MCLPASKWHENGKDLYPIASAVFFLETNQVGELPIIFKKKTTLRLNTTTSNNDTTTSQTTTQLLSNSTQTITGWIETSTRNKLYPIAYAISYSL